MGREKLTIVVLTRNEEKNIAACLETVKWADEIVIVDDGSTDRTVEIAKRYTDKIISHESGGNLAAQRNIGNDKASGDWILQMDADERTPTEFRHSVEALLEENSPYSAFRFGRLNNFCGKFLRFGGEGIHKPMRLFRKGKLYFIETANRIHEEANVSGQVGEIDMYLEHYNFPDIGHYIATQNHYTDVEAADLYKTQGLLTPKELKGRMTIGPVKLFIKIYFKHKGYRDGMHGLIFAILSAWRRFLLYAKYWELNKEKYEKEPK